ncbi:MAG: ABC transporter permease [Egibacteraceae bacterium]
MRKELSEIVRQPRLALVMVLGPFLVLLVFGLNLKDEDPDLDTVVVLPEGSPLGDEARSIQERLDDRITITGFTPDRSAALAQLAAGTTDLVLVLPQDPLSTILQGRQANVLVFHDRYDPVESLVIALSASAATDAVNQQVWQGLVENAQTRAGELLPRIDRALQTLALAELALRLGQQEQALLLLAGVDDESGAIARGLEPVIDLAGSDGLRLGEEAPPGEPTISDTLGLLRTITSDPENVDVRDLNQAQSRLTVLQESLTQFRGLPAAVLVDPFRSITERVTAGTVQLTDFYSPAVIVLLVQHVIVSFLSLSVVRDEQLGTIELYRVAPIRALDIVLGKYLAQIFIAGAVGVTLILLLRFGLGVPVRGSLVLIMLTLGGLLFASAGIGFLTGMVADSDRQAVQYAMMVLLASIFLGGFILTLARFTRGLQIGALILPATHGNRIFRELMLRGTTDGWGILLLIATGAALFALNIYLLQRRLAVR